MKKFSKALLILALSLLVSFSLQGQIKEKPQRLFQTRTNPKVNGMFVILNTQSMKICSGYVQIRHKGKTYKDGLVLLEGRKVPFDNQRQLYTIQQMSPGDHIRSLKLVIKCPLLFSDEIVVNGIVTGPFLKITKPDTNSFNPYIKNFRVNWSEAFGSQVLRINKGEITIFKKVGISGTSQAVNPKIFADLGTYIFDIQQERFLEIKGPASSDSFFTLIKRAKVKSLLNQQEHPHRN